MESITIKNGVANFRKNEYSVTGARKVDDNSFELITDKGTFNFQFGELEINGAAINNFSDLPFTEKKPAPNWLDLEQQLRYCPLFQKAWEEATDKGLSLFMITLVNGKSGVASENALAFAFEKLGVEWDEKEKEEINQHLANNNFSISI